jgi:hypothetical protein
VNSLVGLAQGPLNTWSPQFDLPGRERARARKRERTRSMRTERETVSSDTSCAVLPATPSLGAVFPSGTFTFTFTFTWSSYVNVGDIGEHYPFQVVAYPRSLPFNEARRTNAVSPNPVKLSPLTSDHP